MNISADRFSLDRIFISKGQLKIEEKEHATILTYSDNHVHISASALHHPIKALEKLRQQLEAGYNSTLAINGCRIDTSYRATGGYRTYITEHGKQAIAMVSLFNPTKRIDKICKVDEHKSAYKSWIDSLSHDKTTER